jgi:hypothetical protein
MGTLPYFLGPAPAMGRCARRTPTAGGDAHGVPHRGTGRRPTCPRRPRRLPPRGTPADTGWKPVPHRNEARGSGRPPVSRRPAPAPCSAGPCHPLPFRHTVGAAAPRGLKPAAQGSGRRLAGRHRLETGATPHHRLETGATRWVPHRFSGGGVESASPRGTPVGNRCHTASPVGNRCHTATKPAAQGGRRCLAGRHQRLAAPDRAILFRSGTPWAPQRRAG